ncbi:MAG: hypothetical protein ACYSWO_28565 [Planctomycetota bacterium]|jgi:hypothetical protein
MIEMPNRQLVMIAACTVLALVVQGANAEVFLPGMQPNEAGIEFVKVQQCRMCHGGTENGDADPFLSWQTGLMSISAKNPLFRAALAIANQDVEGIGEFCLRCHAPRAWLEGRSTPTDGSSLNREDLYGVSCTVCHSYVDPLSDEAAKIVEATPPGYGNAMMVSDPQNLVRGPYGDGTGAMPHGVVKSPFHASSELCGVCHNISNPLLADDVRTQAPQMFGHIQRTYSEWLLSDFAKRGRDGTCQSCHYRPVKGGGQASRFGDLKRDYFAMHGPVGGSTWVQDATFMAWKGRDLDRTALDLSKQRAKQMLEEAATLDLSFNKPGFATLRITNETGHKLPSGYEEGRRMWVNAVFLDSSGKILKEIGIYGEKDDTVFGKTVAATTLLDPDQTRVYEILFGISEARAKKYGKSPGKSFRSVLNDYVVKDNRIPPRGFNNARFAEHLSRPVGATYADGQHWDEVELELPRGCGKVIVKLMYESMSWEYLKFLADENKTDDWGRRLYEIWTKTGRCKPTVMATIEKDAQL